MDSYTSLVVLCEDRQQEVFARRFLERCGVIPKRIRYRTCPRGKGAGGLNAACAELARVPKRYLIKKADEHVMW